MPSVDVIIPTHMNEDLTIRCVESVAATTADYRIIWVDGGSFGSSRMKVLQELGRHPNLPVWIDSNPGFARLVNIGVKAGDSPLVAILHNDAELTPGWLERMSTSFKRDSRVICVGPLTDTDGYWQNWRAVGGSGMFENVPDFEIKDKSLLSKLADERFKNHCKTVKDVRFFCALLKRSAFLDHGYLDEEYGHGPLADVDYCEKLRRDGHKIAFCPWAFVRHDGGSTFKALRGERERAELLAASSSRLKRKYADAAL